jgi:hypothetical protein
MKGRVKMTVLVVVRIDIAPTAAFSLDGPDSVSLAHLIGATRHMRLDRLGRGGH